MNENPGTIGPYRILKTLGRGAMGVVYQGAHQATGRLAAIKTVRVSQESLLQSIRREIHALARLKHPGIVPILEEGLEHGAPWYAMELIQGMTLRRYAAWANGVEQVTTELEPSRHWWTRSIESSASDLGAVVLDPRAGPSGGVANAPGGEVLISLLTVVRRLCGALSFLHGEGIVHRDLKPENILLRPAGGEQFTASGSSVQDSDSEFAAPAGSSLAARRSPLTARPWPVLMDFGIASRFGAGELTRETLEVAGNISGTVAYMAPEQARGEYVDARADLYSLGCILYELVAGRPPFVHASPIEVLHQHLEHEPIPPSRLVEGVHLISRS